MSDPAQENLDHFIRELTAVYERHFPVDPAVLTDAIGLLQEMQRRQLAAPEPIDGIAVVVAQAVDMLGQAFDDDGHPFTASSARAFVLAQRERAGLPNPTPAQLDAALIYLKRQQARD